MSKRTTILGLLLVGTVLAWAPTGGEEAQALPRGTAVAAKNADAALEKKLARDVRRVAKVTIRDIKKSAKAKVKELKTIGKAIRAGTAVERYLGGAQPPAKGGRNLLDHYGRFDAYELQRFCYDVAQAWVPEIMEKEDGSRDQVAETFRRFYEFRERNPSDAAVAAAMLMNESVTGAMEGVREAVQQAFGDVTAAVRKNHTILNEIGPSTVYYLGPPRAQPAPEEPFAFTDPNVIWNYADADGRVIFTVHFPASDGQGAYDIDVVLTAKDGTPITQIPGTQDAQNERFWNVSTEGVDPGLYLYELITTEGDEECCAERGVIVVPDLPPTPVDPGDPPKCDITTGGTFDFGMMSPGTVVLDDFLPFVPRAIVSPDRQTFYYLELGFFELNDGGSGGITIDFGPNGVPVADEIQFGPGSPGQSFFSVMSPNTMGRENPASPISANHELEGTLCIDTRTLQFGSPAASISVTATGDVVDRMGDRNALIGTVDIDIGALDIVNIETQ